MEKKKIQIKVDDKELASIENGKISVNLEQLYEAFIPLSQLHEYLAEMTKVLVSHSR